MENKPESNRITKRENWQYVFKMKQYENHKYYIFRFYVNFDRTKIKQSRARKDTIIICPIELDYLICNYLCDCDKHFLVTMRLIEIINNMFDICSKECYYCNEWIQKLNELRKIYNGKGMIPWLDPHPGELEAHDYIFNLYTAKDW